VCYPYVTPSIFVGAGRESKGSRPLTGGSGSLHQQQQLLQFQEPDPPAITVGGPVSGWVPPFGSQTIELVFTPLSVGQHVAKFLITFSHYTANSVSDGVAFNYCGWVRNSAGVRTGHMYRTIPALHVTFFCGPLSNASSTA
jgi:hypothetical protein